MTPLWTSDDAAAATGGRTTREWQATGVSIDTRSLKPGDLFVALTAARDAHDFVAMALQKGAAAALVMRRPENVPEDAPLLIVSDVLKALEELGRAARARTNARVAAVTGSVGKTSTKDMLRAVLEGQGKTHAAEASYNNHWGVPLTLARMPADTDYAVIEIGMSNPGEIAPLARLARPHVALITTVAAAHLAAFGDLDGIAREKATIFEGLEPGGVAIINGDLDVSPILRKAAEAAATRMGGSVVSFGMKPANHHRLTDVRVREGSTVGTARAWRTKLLLKVATTGRHFAMNALGALAVTRALGADRAQTLCALAIWSPPAGRGTRETLVIDALREGESIDLIDDAFNANPTSLSAALDVLSGAVPRDGVGRVSRGRRIAILGDMLELGAAEHEIHAAIADEAGLKNVHVVHCVGPRMRALYDVLPDEQRGRWAETAAELAEVAGRLVDSGDVVLVKGSKGSHVSVVVDAIRKLGHRSASLDIEV